MLKQIAEGIPTTGTLDTPIGRLEVSNGYPTEATTKKLFDEMDFQRAVQAYLWALPMIGSAQWQNEQHDKFGAGDLDYVDYLDFKDKLGLLTANATTPYSIAFINLAKTGPLVVEIPVGAIAGGIVDVWQRPITDTGALGPEKSKGGKFLILGPNDPDMKREGYYVFHSPTSNIWSGQRGLDPDKAKPVGNGACIVRRNQQELAPLAGVGAGQSDVAEIGVSVDRRAGDRALPKIEQDPLQVRRRFEHQRTALAEIDIAHRIDDVGVGRRDQRLGVEPVLPDRQDVVAGAEDPFRAELHAERVDERQRPEIDLCRALEDKLVLERRARFRSRTVFEHRRIGERIKMVSGHGSRLPVLRADNSEVPD
jgi:hypothetical protein